MPVDPNVNNYYSSSISSPIILDLNNVGIQITSLPNSNIFFDMAGDGKKHRTAWAAPGNGVLVFDTQSDGVIDQRNEVVFTDWDRNAETDLEALRSVFDTNGDGHLTSADAQWSKFKVMVSNADGTTTLQTLAALGITSINLIADKTRIVLPDGSVITGQSSFVKSGVTHKLADTELTYDATGYALVRTESMSGSSKVIENKLLKKDGSLAGSIKQTTTSNGLTINLDFDRDGDGIVDDKQSRVTVVNGDSSRTETVQNSIQQGRLIDRVVTTTSADKKTINIARDLNADSYNDQLETRVTASNGSLTVTVADYARSTMIKQVTTIVSADGLTRTITSDFDGNGQVDERISDVTTVGGTGIRTQVIQRLSDNYTLLAKETKTISANGRETTSVIDEDGSTTTDRTDHSLVTHNVGSTTSVLTVKNGNNSIRSVTEQTVSTDGLTIQTNTDLNGDGIKDVLVSDVTVIGSDTPYGAYREETITARNGDGSLRSSEITRKYDNNRARNTSTDADGDGIYELTEVIAAAVGGASTATTSFRDNDFSLITRSEAVTSANGLTRTTREDHNGDAVYDTIIERATAINVFSTPLGTNATIVTTSTRNNNTSLRSKSEEHVSNNNLTRKTRTDIDGDGTWDIIVDDVTTIGSGRAKTQTINTTSENGSRHSLETITVSTDGQTVTRSVQYNGDSLAYPSISETTTTFSSGNIYVSSQFRLTGGVYSQTFQSESISANMFSTSKTYDIDGDSDIDRRLNKTIQLVNDGSKTTSFTDTAYIGGNPANPLLKSSITTSVSGNGLVTNYIFDGFSPLWFTSYQLFKRSATDVTTINNDGSRTQVVTTTRPSSVTVDTSTTIVSDDRLVTTKAININGTGTVEINTSVTLGLDGSKTETGSWKTIGGALSRKSESYVSDDGLYSEAKLDSNGDNIFDRFTTSQTQADRSVTTSIVNKTAGGALKDAVVSNVAANGMRSTRQIDVNGDSIGDVRTSTVETVATTGFRTTVTSNYNSVGSLISRGTTVTSDDGLVSYTTVDSNGDGTTTGISDYSISRTVVVSEEGVTTTSEVSTLFDITPNVRSKIVTSLSADGLLRTTYLDRDGHNYLSGDHFDKIIVEKSFSDGSSGVEIYYGSEITVPNRYLVETRSADGLSFQRLFKNGVYELTEVITEANGSYTWERSGIAQSAHAISVNGVDTWALKIGSGSVKTEVLDVATRDYFMSQAARIYGAVFDRTMTDYEKETLVQYITNGVFNTKAAGGLIPVLLAATEFSVRYGASLSNAQFLERIYRNAFDDSPTLGWMTDQLTALVANTKTRSDIVLEVANDSRHLVDGIVRPVDEKTPGAEVYTIERVEDKALARNMVMKIHDIIYNSVPSSGAIQNSAMELWDGTANPWKIVNDYYYPSGELNTAFVQSMFWNAFNRNPTTQESVYWVAALDDGHLTRVEFIYMLAMTPEHGHAHVAQTLGTAGADLMTGTANPDSLNGGAGNDTLIGGAGPDTLNGGADTDRVSYSTAASGVVVDLRFPLNNIGDAWGDQYISIEEFALSSYSDVFVGALAAANKVWGGGGADTITGGGLADSLTGEAGNDSLIGLAGADTLSGGAGNDTVVGGDGNDWLYGGADNDLMFGDDGADAIWGDAGNDTIFGGAGNDTAYGGTQNDHLYGQAGNDTLYGNDGDDWLSGDADHDRLEGGNGHDILFGGTGNDTLLGGDGNDQLFGGAGTDSLTGGAGADTFAFEALLSDNYDTITDFTVAQADKISISRTGFGLQPNYQFINGQTFISGASPVPNSNNPTMLYYTSGYLYWDADGNGPGAATLLAFLTGAPALTASSLSLY